MEPGRSAGGNAAHGSMMMRLIIPVVSTLAGMGLSTRLGAGIVPGVLWGLTAGTAVVLLEYRASRVPTGYVVGAIAGMALGSLVAWLVGIPIDAWFPGGSRTAEGALQAVGLLAGFLVGARKGAGVSVGSLRRTLTGSETEGPAKVLDTSSIIDGRIADVCDAGFLEGPLYVPQFILGELQHIADSSDSSKRTRGRRGLDVLRRLQKISDLDIRIVDDDYPKIRDVDAKLLAFAKVRLAKVITNDFNLNKVAEVQGVRVLNINELANAMKPPVLPGENLRVYVQKEGKEPNQGVAYLDDGTMVVVEQGRELMNRTVSVTVTSVLQTTAGRMIFARPGVD